MAKKLNPTEHRMTRRSQQNDYSQPGMYHITLRVADSLGRPFGRVIGDASLPDGSDGAPHVQLSAIGQMVRYELLNSIRTYYPMVEVQDYVVMPEHMHFILEVHEPLVSTQGRKAHLGLVIAGFKKGCNRRYWEMTGQSLPEDGRRGKPAGTDACGGQNTSGSQNAGGGSCPAVFPQGAAASQLGAATSPQGAATSQQGAAPSQQGYKVPSRISTGRPVLFSEGFVDVMPLKSGQLAQQRAYIRNNPRSRLLRSTHRSVLQPLRGGIDTALTVKALMGYLKRECAPSQLTPAARTLIESRLLTTNGKIGCDSYGNRQLLSKRLLPVVCHRRDVSQFPRQKAACLQAAQEGTVLVSARIAEGEQDIMDTTLSQGYPIILILDNGMPDVYHPSEKRMELCLEDRLLIVTPWQHHYRRTEEGISVVECKTMNCMAQALCRTRDDWWKTER
ncbi:MAG: hypothetical protein K6D37_07575 [Prevotella sp.]|nr:hypothetical protein [Prevotella sp.]